jgi:hypothetical protein
MYKLEQERKDYRIPYNTESTVPYVADLAVSENVLSMCDSFRYLFGHFFGSFSYCFATMRSFPRN